MWAGIFRLTSTFKKETKMATKIASKCASSDHNFIAVATRITNTNTSEGTKTESEFLLFCTKCAVTSPLDSVSAA